MYNINLKATLSAYTKGALIQEAPIDGKMYVRRDGDWTNELQQEVIQDTQSIQNLDQRTSQLENDVQEINQQVESLDQRTTKNEEDIVDIKDEIDQIEDNYVKKSGDTMTGNLNMANNKVICGMLETTGVVSFGGLYCKNNGNPINMNTNRIQNVGTPVNNSDAATKQYVDSKESVLLNKDLVEDFDISVASDHGTITKQYYNLNNGQQSEEDIDIPLANSTSAGFMSPASVEAIQDLTEKVSQLEGKTTRLLYSDKQNPTSQEINTYVVSLGYVAPFDGIAVVIDGTYHIWHYYENQSIGWKDDGLDTVQQFTNDIAGIILGSETDGKVYAEDDGTGSVVGWDNVKTRITNLETNSATKSELITETQQRTQADTELGTRIDTTNNNLTAETNRAQLAEQTLTTTVASKVSDVQYNGTSILDNNKVANILTATSISDSPSTSKLLTESALYNYIASGNNGKTRTLDNIDLNTITNTGFYSCNVCTNRPTANNGNMIVVKNGFASDNTIQLYFTFVADKIWIRFKDSGSWQSWKEITSTNEVNDIVQNYHDNTKQDKIQIKQTMDAIATVNTLYSLGQQSAVAITLPNNANIGDSVVVVWYNGSTAASLSIIGTTLTVDYTPSANTRSEINAMWDGTYWCILTNETAVPTGVV